jgi:rod shape-determining protein MreB
MADGLFSSLAGMKKNFSKDIAIDLGTANTLIYAKGRGIVLNEPSIVAVINERGFEVPYLFGNQAKLMLGKTPMKISVHKPLQDGVIADFKAAEEMIKHFIQLVNKNSRIIRPLIIVCVPLDSTAVERRAIQDAAEKCGAKEVYLIEEPMAAAIGAGLPVNDPVGSMVVDIGGGTTEIAIISLGGIVHGRSIKVAGNGVDNILIQYIKQKYNLLIGETTAENIKKDIGIAYLREQDEVKYTKVRGRDLVTGTPKEIEISQTDVVHAVSAPVAEIVEAISLTLETAPPELSSDIVDRGIVLTGGGAMLRNLDYVISEATGLPVFIAPKPLLCVVRGTGIVLEDYKNYSHILFKQV